MNIDTYSKSKSRKLDCKEQKHKTGTKNFHSNLFFLNTLSDVYLVSLNMEMKKLKMKIKIETALLLFRIINKNLFEFLYNPDDKNVFHPLRTWHVVPFFSFIARSTTLLQSLLHCRSESERIREGLRKASSSRIFQTKRANPDSKSDHEAPELESEESRNPSAGNEDR